MKNLRRFIFSLAFSFLCTAFSFIAEFYALYPAALGSDGDPKALAALAVYLIVIAPVSAIPAFVMAIYATRFIF